MKRVLEDITNIENTNIKVTIKREEKVFRKEILKPYLEYTETYYKHLNKVLIKYTEILEKYGEEDHINIYRAHKENSVQQGEKTENLGLYRSIRRREWGVLDIKEGVDLLSIPIEEIFRVDIVKSSRKGEESLSKRKKTSNEKKTEKQSEVNISMRKTLLEWLYDLKVDYKLKSTTYQTAVRIADKYSIIKGPAKNKYQLVGAVSLFIANKLVESKSPGLMAYVDVCDGEYTKEEFLECERDILMAIGGELNFLLPMHLIKEDKFTVGNALCEYSSEAVLLDVSYASLTPRELSEFIESNVTACLSGRILSREFFSLLRESSALFDQQIKQVKDLILRL